MKGRSKHKAMRAIQVGDCSVSVCQSYPDHLGVGHGGGGGLLSGLDHTNRVGAGVRDSRSREANDGTPHEPAWQVIILRQVLVQEVVLQQQHSQGEAVPLQACALNAVNIS